MRVARAQRINRGRMPTAFVKTCIYPVLEVIARAEQPRSPVFLEGLQGLHPTHVVIRPIGRIEHVADLEHDPKTIEPGTGLEGITNLRIHLAVRPDEREAQ